MIAFLQKRFNFDLNYFLGGGVWLFIGQGLIVIKSILISVFLARVFGVEDFGRFAYIMAIFSLASIFGAPGMGIAVFQSVSRGYEGTLLILAKRVFLIGLLGSLFLFIFQFYFNFVQQEQNKYIFLFLSVLFPFYSAGTIFTYYVSGLKKFKLRTYLEAFMSFLIMLFSFVTYLFTQNIYHLSIAIILIQTVISFIYLCYFIRTSNNLVDEEAIDFGRKLNWLYVIPTIKIQLDRILISNYLGYTKNALYNIAYSLGDQVSIIGKIAGTLILPKTASLSHDEIRKRFSLKNIFFVFGFFLFFSLILILICPHLISILFGEDFKEAVPYAQVILLFIPIKALVQILRNVHESQKNTRAIAFINNQLSFIEILLMIFGLLFFQIWGVIFAKIISEIISLIYQVTRVFNRV